jgi:hypothetical protein
LARNIAHKIERMNACRFLVGKPEGKMSLGRHRHGWEDNIKMTLREREWGGTHLIHLAKGRDKWWLL